MRFGAHPHTMQILIIAKNSGLIDEPELELEPHPRTPNQIPSPPIIYTTHPSPHLSPQYPHPHQPKMQTQPPKKVIRTHTHANLTFFLHPWWVCASLAAVFAGVGGVGWCTSPLQSPFLGRYKTLPTPPGNSFIKAETTTGSESSSLACDETLPSSPETERPRPNGKRDRKIRKGVLIRYLFVARLKLFFA
jgi:hypothetical protein